MHLDVMRIANCEALGEAIIAWSKGTEAVPVDVEKLKARLAEAQVGATPPDRFKKVQFVTCDDDTLVIRLLPKDLFEASEAKFAEGREDCVLPPIHENAIRAKPLAGEKLGFQVERIDDYSIADCR